jgi:hypothetical protein
VDLPGGIITVVRPLMCLKQGRHNRGHVSTAFDFPSGGVRRVEGSCSSTPRGLGADHNPDGLRRGRNGHRTPGRRPTFHLSHGQLVGARLAGSGAACAVTSLPPRSWDATIWASSSMPVTTPPPAAAWASWRRPRDAVTAPVVTLPASNARLRKATRPLHRVGQRSKIAREWRRHRSLKNCRRTSEGEAEKVGDYVRVTEARARSKPRTSCALFSRSGRGRPQSMLATIPDARLRNIGVGSRFGSR